MQAVVTVTGTDGSTHSKTVEAESLFDAVRKATATAPDNWALLWWYDPHGIAEVWVAGAPDGCGGVPPGGTSYRVSIARVSRWASARKR